MAETYRGVMPFLISDAIRTLVLLVRSRRSRSGS